MALALATVAVLLVGLVVAVVRLGDDGYPDEWDPRVADLATFVEHERGLQFDHPVYVDFLSASEYTEVATTSEDDLTDADRDELDRYAGTLRALGVASGPLDLFTAYNQVSDGGTLAFYDPADRRVRVRGTEMSVGLRVTLVHELTHALQDQRFDLDRLYEEDVDSSQAVAFRGLVEGDALRVEDAYVAAELSPAEQDDYDAEFAEQVEQGEAAIEDVPPFVSAGFGVPYLLGQPLAEMLANEGGNAAVDDALRDPPSTEEHLFDPASFLAGEEAEEVDLGLDDDVEVLDDGPFGSPSWYLVLAERIDPLTAFDAALGWGGDAYASFERDGTSCIRAAFAGDEAADEEAMTAALDEWAGTLPDGMVEVLDLDGHPGFESCDPGEDVDIEVAGRSEEALYVPSLWGFLVADAATVADAGTARCYAGAVLAGLTYDEIVDPTGVAFGTDEFQQTMSDAYTSCT